MSSMAGAALGCYIDAAVHVDGAAEGPLKGLTFAVKDMFDVSRVSEHTDLKNSAVFIHSQG